MAAPQAMAKVRVPAPVMGRAKERKLSWLRLNHPVKLTITTDHMLMITTAALKSFTRSSWLANSR
jgi:hypothetical protein